MKSGRKRVIALAAALLVSTASVNSYGAVITYISENSEDSENTKKGNGPASTYLDLEDEETEEFAGPGVKKVTLGERYHADYKIYEESIADLFFLYSNVGNGGMTDEAVLIDIPANISYSMEKDGVPMEYTSGQQIYAKGTYVLRLIAIENPELPLSEQTEYQTVFRFRIQEKPPEETEAVKTESYSYTAASYVPETTAYAAVPVETEPEMEALPLETEEVPEESEEADLDPDSEEAAETEPTSVSEASHSQVYSAASGKYQVTLENGVTLTSNIPEGYIGPKAAAVTVNGEAADRVRLYQNDEPIEFVNGNSLMDTGVYRLVADGSTFSFTIASVVNELEYYPAPAGMRFTDLLLDEEAQTLSSDRLLTLNEEGVYNIFMKGADGEELQVKLQKDTTAPELQVTIKGGTAQLQVLSDDVESIHLEKNGALVENFNSNVISSPGHYRLTAVDQAGNTSVQEFTLKYHMNLYGIAVIVLCILLIGGGTAFVLHTKKTMKIR